MELWTFCSFAQQGLLLGILVRNFVVETGAFGAGQPESCAEWFFLCEREAVSWSGVKAVFPILYSCQTQQLRSHQGQSLVKKWSWKRSAKVIKKKEKKRRNKTQGQKYRVIYFKATKPLSTNQMSCSHTPGEVGQRHIEQQQLAGKDKRRNTQALYTRKVNKTQVTAIQMGRAISAEREEQRQEVWRRIRWKQ